MTRSGGAAAPLWPTVGLWMALAASAGCDPPPLAPAEPWLVVTPAALHLGEVEQGTALVFGLRVGNRGAALLRLEGLAGSTACRADAPWPTVGPDSEARIDLSCQTASHGPFRTEPRLLSNDPRAPLPLLLQATVLPLLALDHPLVDLEVSPGQVAVREVQLIGTRRLEAQPTLVNPSVNGLETELLPADEEHGPRLRLRFTGERAGTEVGELTLRTGLTTPTELVLHYRARVRGTLSVEPTTPYFNLRLAAGRRRLLRVMSPQPGFRLLAAEVTRGPFLARSLGQIAGEPTTYLVEVTVAAARVDPEVRGFTGRLRLTSTDRSEPVRELPLVAMGEVGAADPR